MCLYIITIIITTSVINIVISNVIINVIAGQHQQTLHHLKLSKSSMHTMRLEDNAMQCNLHLYQPSSASLLLSFQSLTSLKNKAKTINTQGLKKQTHTHIYIYILLYILLYIIIYLYIHIIIYYIHLYLYITFYHI